MLLENPGEDLYHTVVLENTAIGLASQKPEPRHLSIHVVLRDTARIARAIKRGNVAVKVAEFVGTIGCDDPLDGRLPRLLIELEMHLLADQVLRLQI